MSHHSVSAGGVVINRHSQILVVNQHGLAWSLPKGHIEPGESARAAAEREIYEESGVAKLTFIRELGSYDRHRINLEGGDDPSQTKTIIMFLYRTTQTSLKPLDPENPEARWVDSDEVEDLLTHYKDKAFFASIRSTL